MKERPIIFSGPMVRAILEGRKTQTRRVIVPQPVFLADGGCWYPSHGTARAKHYASEEHLRRGLAVDFCPYGQPGDRLWVRETFRYADPELEGCKVPSQIIYRASVGIVEDHGNLWKPAIFMPRWASRLTLEITKIRVELVQEISEEDAKAEGVPPTDENMAQHIALNFLDGTEPVRIFEFRVLWDSINAKRGFGWDVNPWVWVIEFRKV